MRFHSSWIFEGAKRNKSNLWSHREVVNGGPGGPSFVPLCGTSEGKEGGITIGSEDPLGFEERFAKNNTPTATPIMIKIRMRMVMVSFSSLQAPLSNARLNCKYRLLP